MFKIVERPSVEPMFKPKQELVSCLEELILKVKSGEVDAVAAAFTYRGGGIGKWLSAPDSANGLELLAAVDILHHATAALAIESIE